MSSDKLGDDELEINAILKSKGYYTFTVNEYTNQSDAEKLLKKYRNRKNSLFGDTNFNLFIYKNLNYKRLPNTKINITVESQIVAVRELFKLTTNSLITKIIDPYYEEYCTQDEDGNFHFNTEIESKMERWLKFCKQIDLCYLQYKKDEGQWIKSTKDKKIYTEYWRDLAQKELFKNNKDIKFYVEFLNQGYGLNNKVKLKSEYLLSLKFPNINDKIAKEIVKTSSLLR